MDSKLQALLASMAAAGRRPVSDGTPEQARAQLAARKQGPGRELHRIYDDAVPTSGGMVPVRVYLPGPDVTGTLVYFHGGGWVMGTLDSFDNVARGLAFHSGARCGCDGHGCARSSALTMPCNSSVNTDGVSASCWRRSW